MGIFAGYWSARVYKTFKLEKWQNNAIQTATLVPSILLGCIFILNFFFWSQKSSNAIPFGTFCALISMWFGISVPLVMLGAFFGKRKKTIEHPVRTHQIPRQIGETVWYLRTIPSILISGIIPFAVIFLELFFIIKSVWTSDQFYYMFGFMGLVFSILILSCVEITIVTIYFLLSSENYKWHWRSFMISSSSTFYIFAYSIYFFVTRLDFSESISGLAYFVYAFIGCFVYWLCTGTIGFICCYWFLIKIYGAVKLD
jgi:transmembrane 9 superfamily protein 2/4